VNFRVVDYWVHVVLLTCFIVAIFVPATVFVIFSVLWLWQVASLVVSKFLGILTPARKKYAWAMAAMTALWGLNYFYFSILFFALILINILMPFWYFRIIRKELDEDYLN